MKNDTQGAFFRIPSSSWLLDACHFHSSLRKCILCNRACAIVLFYLILFTTCNVRCSSRYEMALTEGLEFKSKAFSHSTSLLGYAVMGVGSGSGKALENAKRDVQGRVHLVAT